MTTLRELATDMAAMGGISELATQQEKDKVAALALSVITEISKRLGYYSRAEQEAITVQELIQTIADKYGVK